MCILLICYFIFYMFINPLIKGTFWGTSGIFSWNFKCLKWGLNHFYSSSILFSMKNPTFWYHFELHRSIMWGIMGGLKLYAPWAKKHGFWSNKSMFFGQNRFLKAIQRLLSALKLFSSVRHTFWYQKSTWSDLPEKNYMDL